MRTFIFNSNNLTPAYGNNQFSYPFIGGGVEFKKGDKVCIQSICIPYSVRNITGANNNNYFSYKLNGVTYRVSIADGFYQTSDLNGLLQSALLANGHYYLDSNGNYVWFCQISTNVQLYGIQFDSFTIPTSLPAGYTNPANVLYNTVTITSPTCIQLVVPSTNITQLLGYSAGTYPATPQSSTYSVVSTSTPNLTPVNSIIIRCSLSMNKHSIVPDALFSFSPNTTYGSNIIIEPTIPGWIDCKEGIYSSIDITMVDQNYRPITLLDTNLVIQMLVKSAEE
jgi:hypothetical protein